MVIGAIVAFAIIMIFALVPSQKESMKCVFCDETKNKQSFRR